MKTMKSLSPALILFSLATLMPAWALADEFRVRSASQINGRLSPAQYANAFGCTGGNRSPQVQWSGAPAGTKSFVVTMYDPDAPTGSGWWHWVIANIPATVGELPEGAGSPGGQLPAGAVAVRGDGGGSGYLGACPPLGQTHRYIIAVHALKVDKLDLPPETTPALVGFMGWANGLGTATLTLSGSRGE